MPNPQTEPSTPFRSLGALTNPSKNARQNKARISAIHLPRHDLCDVLAEYLQRRAHRERVASLPKTGLPKRHIQALAKRLASHGNNSPKRACGSHAANKRRRRSSAGVYESLYAESISKDFLRTFSRTIVRENGGPAEETLNGLSRSCPVLGKDPGPQFSEVREDLTHQFDQSLPLPTGNHMITPINVRGKGAGRNLRVRREYDFMKYLDHAAEGDGHVFRKDYTSVFETEFSTPRSRQEPHFYSDSGADYNLRSDFERAILYSRQALMDGGSSEGVVRPLMDYDDQEVFSNLNVSSSQPGSTARSTLSRSIADSPFFLKKKAASPAEKPETLKVTSPLTPSKQIKDFANAVTPPHLIRADHKSVQVPHQIDNVIKSAIPIKKSESEMLAKTKERDLPATGTGLSSNSEKHPMLPEVDHDIQPNKFTFTSPEVVNFENKMNDI